MGMTHPSPAFFVHHRVCRFQGVGGGRLIVLHESPLYRTLAGRAVARHPRIVAGPAGRRFSIIASGVNDPVGAAAVDGSAALRERLPVTTLGAPVGDEYARAEAGQDATELAPVRRPVVVLEAPTKKLWLPWGRRIATRKRSMIDRRLVLGTLSATLVAAGLGGCTTTAEQRLSREEAARASLNELYRTVPAARSLGEGSAAVLVFPTIVRGGLMIGGQLGDGVMFENGEAVGFYRVAGGSFGLQAGAQSFAQAYFFTTEEALQTFRDMAGWEVGAGVSVAVATVGAAGQINTSTLQAPVVVFVYGQAGLMAGIQVEGQRITPLGEA